MDKKKNSCECAQGDGADNAANSTKSVSHAMTRNFSAGVRRTSNQTVPSHLPVLPLPPFFECLVVPFSNFCNELTCPVLKCQFLDIHKLCLISVRMKAYFIDSDSKKTTRGDMEIETVPGNARNTGNSRVVAWRNVKHASKHKGQRDPRG